MKKKIFSIFIMLFALIGVSLNANAEEAFTDPNINEGTTIVEDDNQNKDTINPDDKEVVATDDTLAESIDYYIRLIVSYIVSVLGTITGLLTAFKIIKKITNELKGGKKTFDEAKEELALQQDKMNNLVEIFKEETNKLVSELKKSSFDNNQSVLEIKALANQLMDENKSLKDKLVIANGLIAKLIVSNPDFASSGIASEILKLLDEGGANDESEN